MEKIIATVKPKREYKPNRNKDIARKIKAIRKALDLTQDEMAKESGYTQTGIASLESGIAEPGFKFIRYLIVDKHVNSGYIFHNESTMFAARNVVDNVQKMDSAVKLLDDVKKVLGSMRFTK